MSETAAPHPIDAQPLFDLDRPLQVPAWPAPGPHVPALDPHYRFDADATLAILLGFAHGQRVLLQGLHGTGKSSHIEQVAARLNWPCLRVNLDAHLSRADLIGRDVVRLREGLQVTEFDAGILPWALAQPMALVLDEYDAGRPEVMFVIQRLLEEDGRFTLLEQNQVLTPHPHFRLFATANTLGAGDPSGLYAGAQLLNQAQLDRWQLIARLDYLSAERESAWLRSRLPAGAEAELGPACAQMVALAGLVRAAFRAGDLGLPMSPRSLLAWSATAHRIGDRAQAFRLCFLNRCEPAEHALLGELYQRAMGAELAAGDNR